MTTRGSGVRGVARLVVVALVACTVAVSATVGSAAPQTPPADDGVVSFGQAPEVAVGAMSPNEVAKLEGAVRSRFVDIPTGTVSPSLDAGLVDLELLPGVAVTLDGDGAPTPGVNGSMTWSGLAADGDYATFTFVAGVVYGTAAVDGSVYDISPVSGKTHLVVEEGRVFPDEAEPVGGHDQAADSAAVPEAPAVESAGTPTIDVLTWYDNFAADFYGGNSNAQNELTATINETNAAYARSGANLTIASVGIEYVNYTGTGDASTELARLANVADGPLDSVHARRNALNADLVSVVTDLSDACGMGYLRGPASGANGFSVVDAGCARGGLSYAHELGHNMGAGHAPGDTDPGGLFSYSYGYRDTVNDFRTIMAYDSSSCPGGSCPRIAYFSSPSALYNGHPTGSAAQDNARTLTERATIVAAYRGASTPTRTSVKISASSWFHTCAVLASSTVRCWGSGWGGPLGYPGGWGLAIGDDETPGSVGPVNLGTGRAAVDVSAGIEYTCAVLDDGSVHCWGSNGSGQLGYANTTRLVVPGGPVDLGAGLTAVQISAGYEHTCALLENGDVQCWGRNSWGQLGYGNTTIIGDDETPGSAGPVDLGAGRTAVQVSTGQSHTCAVLDDATVLCWGYGGVGATGHFTYRNPGPWCPGWPCDPVGTTIGDDETPGSVGPVDIGVGRTAVQLDAGGNHTCALLDNGDVRCWGANDVGQLGYGNTDDVGDSETPGSVGPVDLGVGRTAVQISVGHSNTCAVLDNGTVRCWGLGADGRLGYGNTSDIGDDESPGSVSPLNFGAGRTAVQVSTGQQHNCAVLDDGSFRCWGRNDYGQLGYGNTDYVGTPASAADVPLVGVAGTVTEPGTGAPVPGAFVAVLRSTDFAIAGGAVSDATGRFSATVGEGDYFLYLIDPTGTHRTGFHGAPTTVNVADDALTDADPLMPRLRGSITATVTETGTGNPIPGVWGLALSASASNTGATELAVTANGSGQLTLPGLTPGNHYVGFVDPAGAHTTRFFPNSPNVPDATRVAVTAGGTTPANASLPTQTPVETGAVISGTITSEGTNLPLAGARVVALRASDYTMVRGAVTDGSGEYSLDVAPGEYKLAILDGAGLHDMEWFENQPNTGLGSALSVTAPGTANAALSPSTGSLSGTVTDDLGATPIGGAWVLAIGPTGIAGGTLTAVDGTYTIAGLTPGTYRAAFVDPDGGRVQEYWDNSTDYEGATTFTVTAANTTPGIDAALATPTLE